MKKKYLYFLSLISILIIPMSKVEATKVTPKANSKDCTATLQLNKMHDPGNNNYWNIKANGEQAFCIDPGKKAFSGEKCQTMPASSASDDQLRIISYAKDSDSYVNTSGLNYQQQQSIYVALSKGEYEEVNDIVKGNSNSNLGSQIVNEFRSSPKANLGSNAVIMYCNGDMTGEKYQRMIVNAQDLGCTPEPDDDDPKDMSCTDGAMNLDNPSTSCYPVFNGIETYYSYTASGGGDPFVHSKYGEDSSTGRIGEYCTIFCQEYGTSILPGALGTAIRAGSHIIWPTSESNQQNKFTKDMYPMSVKGKKECKLVMMPDHGDYPTAGTGGCNQDPYGDYMCLYNGSSVYETRKPKTCKNQAGAPLKKVGDQGDYFDGTKYEIVRRTNGSGSNDYFKKPEACGDQMQGNGTADRGEGCSFQKYKIDYVASKYYNGAKYVPYNQKVQLINHNADVAADTCKAAKEAERAYLAVASLPDIVDEFGNSHEDPVKTQARDEMNRRRDEANKAREAYQKAVEWVQEHVYKSIEKCQQYTKAFNTARKILDAIADCGNFSIDDPKKYYNFSATGYIEFTSGTNGRYSVYGKLKQSGGGVSCTNGCGGLGFTKESGYLTLNAEGQLDTPDVLKRKVEQIENREIVLEAKEVKYELDKGYSYIDKNRDEYKKYKPSSNYETLKTLSGDLAKVLPTDYNSPIVDNMNNAINYDLVLSGVTFGHYGRFQVNDGNSYVCKYTMTKDGGDECTCPEDTPGDGKDLMSYVIKGESCADAQAKYCDSGGDGDCDEKCYYCVFDNKVVDITGCVKAGKGLDACKAQFCSGGGNEYKCKNSNGIRTGMDITSCVTTKMTQGYNEDQALNYCDEIVCPISNGRIIYRTIRLEAPFPGEKLNNSEKIINAVRGFNYDPDDPTKDVGGRYPGENWNGKQLVYKKIRYNRNAAGTKIYQTKKPIYSFELNGATIKRIRDYNSGIKEGYNDFNLTCMKNNHSACVSKFIKNRMLSGLVGGVCAGASNNSNFYTCLYN